MGWGSHKEPRGGERGLGPPPASASAAAGSGCDKLNLRALEKLQEEESEECAEWLKGALSPRELRPPRPAPPSPEPARRPGKGVARLQLREYLRPKKGAPPAPPTTSSAPARAARSPDDDIYPPAPPQEPGRGRARWGRGRREGAGSKRHGQRHARPERQDRGAAAIALSSWLPAPGPSPGPL